MLTLGAHRKHTPGALDDARRSDAEITGTFPLCLSSLYGCAFSSLTTRGGALPNHQARRPKSERHAALLQRLGTTIRTYRQRKAFTLEDLRGLTNLSLSYLSQIERGERNASVLSLITIADALDIPYTNLLEPLNAFRPSSPPVGHPSDLLL